jgi:predicted ATPase
MGAVPDPQTQALYAKIRDQATRPQKPQAPAVSTPNNLPRLLDSLIGREDECAEVAERLKAHRLVTLAGMGGIGKTRLALAVAERTLTDFPQGVWFVPFDRLAPGGDVVPIIASVLGGPGDPRLPLIDSVVEALGPGSSLLILDNCEHVLTAASTIVAFLLRANPCLRILATSRQPFGLPSEELWLVPSLATPEPSDLPDGRATRLRVAMAFESVCLFTERAQAAEPRFALEDGNVASVVEICADLEGIPLALELAATRVRTMPLETLARRLRDSRLELLHTRRGSEGRQSALRATLQWSFDLLTARQRRLLLAMSICVGGWNLEFAESAEAFAAKRVLDSLIAQSFVFYDPSQNRYRMLETVREYALERLRETGEEDAARLAHQRWCLAFAERIKAAPRDPAWIKEISAEEPNLLEATSFQSGEDPEAGLRIATGLVPYWNVRGYHGRAQLLASVLDRSPDASVKVRAWALNGLGKLDFTKGDLAEARRRLEEALALFQECDDVDGIASTLGNLAIIATVVGEEDRAIEIYESAFDAWSRAGDRLGLARGKHNLSILLFTRGEYPRSRALLEESLATSITEGDVPMRGYGLTALGFLALALGDHEAARNAAKEAYELAQETSDRVGEASALGVLGECCRDLGEEGEARQYLAERLRIAEQIGSLRELGAAQLSLGTLEKDVGNTAEAERLLRASLANLREAGDAYVATSALRELGNALRAKAELRAAREVLEESLSQARDSNSRLARVQALEGLALLTADEGDVGTAVLLIEAADAYRRRLGAPRPPIEETPLNRPRAAGRERLGLPAYESFVTRGRHIDWLDAEALAFKGLTP